MSRKHCLCLSIIVLFCVSLVTAPTGFAIEVLTKEKALKQVFFKNAEIEVVTKELSEANIEKIKKMLGGTMVFVQEGSESEAVDEEDEIEFYFAKRGGNG